MQNHIDDYGKFARSLIPTLIFTALLSSAITSLTLTMAGYIAPYFPSWPFMLLQIVIGSFGVWWFSKNGKKKK